MLSIRYRAISNIRGPLLFVEGIPNVRLGELVRIHLDGEIRNGQILEIREKVAVIQVFEGTAGLSRDSSIMLTGRPVTTPVSAEVFGRVFDGMGRTIDGGPPIRGSEEREIQGRPINPIDRVYPEEFIETGISAIDGLLSLVRGQKLPVFSGGGLPHNELAAQIVRQARVLETGEKFAVVLVAVGITHEEANFFITNLRAADVMERVIIFLNISSDSTIERLLTPRLALTTAEYLAFDLNYHVLTVILDVTNYCEALREVATARGEAPGRRGYPGYMYTDLASLYERAGRIYGKAGSVTIVPIISMPDYDITHPIPDLTGYITEGQIVLSQDLHLKGVYPPIDILPSLSRLMKDGIGEGKTRGDHMQVSNRIYAAYSRGRNAMNLALVLGRGALTEEERRYLAFAEAFEKSFMKQGRNEHRPIDKTLDLGLGLLKMVE